MRLNKNALPTHTHTCPTCRQDKQHIILVVGSDVLEEQGVEEIEKALDMDDNDYSQMSPEELEKFFDSILGELESESDEIEKSMGESSEGDDGSEDGGSDEAV